MDNLQQTETNFFNVFQKETIKSLSNKPKDKFDKIKFLNKQISQIDKELDLLFLCYDCDIKYMNYANK